jgi:alkylhydroperoxidase family enzyme
LRYSDALVFDPPDVPDDVVKRLQRSFSDAEILELTWAICLWIETGRLFAALDVPYGADAPSGLPIMAQS